MMPLKVIMAISMMMFSPATAVPEPIPVAMSEAFPPALPKTAPMVVPDIKG